MAIEYIFKLATELKPSEVSKILASKFGLEADSAQLLGPGVNVSVIGESDLGKSIIRDVYKFEPTLRVSFRLDKFEDFERGLEITIRATLELLRATRGDGILLFNGDTPVLLAVSGALVLNSEDFWEDSALLSLVNMPYEMRHIPPL